MHLPRPGRPGWPDRRRPDHGRTAPEPGHQPDAGATGRRASRRRAASAQLRPGPADSRPSHAATTPPQEPPGCADSAFRAWQPCRWPRSRRSWSCVRRCVRGGHGQCSAARRCRPRLRRRHRSAVAGGPPHATAGTAPARHGGRQGRATAATAGGLCSVPGIGDIGGLFGFCAAGSSGVLGDLNNVCQPSLPDPEPADAGIDAMVAPPASGKQPATLVWRVRRSRRLLGGHQSRSART